MAARKSDALSFQYFQEKYFPSFINLTPLPYSRSFANIMPYMASYMRQQSAAGSSGRLTYADFIVVHSAWGFTQGCVLPIGGALVGAVGNGAAVTGGSLLFAAAPIVTAFTIRLERERKGTALCCWCGDRRTTVSSL